MTSPYRRDRSVVLLSVSSDPISPRVKVKPHEAYSPPPSCPTRRHGVAVKCTCFYCLFCVCLFASLFSFHLSPKSLIISPLPPALFLHTFLSLFQPNPYLSLSSPLPIPDSPRHPAVCLFAGEPCGPCAWAGVEGSMNGRSVRGACRSHLAPFV